MRINKYLKIVLRIFIALVLVLMMIPLGVVALITNENISRWILNHALPLVAETISIKSFHGRLQDGLVLQGLHLHTDTQAIDLASLILRWQLAEVWQTRHLKIQQLHLDGLRVLLQKSDEKSEFNPDDPLHLPLGLTVEDFKLTSALIHQEGKDYALQNLQFAASIVNDELQLHSLKIIAKPLQATLQGKSGLGNGFPFQMQLNWQAAMPDYGHWQGMTHINGNAHTIQLANQIQSPLQLTQQAKIDNLPEHPHFVVQNHWQHFRYPFIGKEIQMASPNGQLKISGTPENYALDLQAQLLQPQLPATQLLFQGQGTLTALKIAQLAIISKLGELKITGNLSWEKLIAFDMQAHGQHFNPAILQPEMKGDLNFNTAIKGQKNADKLKLDVDIANFKGVLRNYPLNASGKLSLNDNQLQVNGLTVNSGVNQLSVKGGLGLTQQTAALDIVLNAPELKSLYPHLGGNLQLQSHLEGALKNPSIQLSLAGKNLAFEQHALENIQTQINYEPNKTSQFQLTASGLKTADKQITQFSLNGSGTLQQHQWTAKVKSNLADIELSLNGKLNGQQWQTQLTQLQINEPHAGEWQLATLPFLEINQLVKGVNLSLSETCFTQKEANLCLQGAYFANQDFQAAIQAHLPTQLAKKYFPSNLKLDSVVDAQFQVSQKQKQLQGTYQITMPATQVSVTNEKITTVIPLNTVAFSGQLNKTQLSNTFNLVFADKNYLRGQVQFDTANQKTLTGELNALIDNFDLAKTYLPPELSEVKGGINAALNFAGTLDKPTIAGSLNLNNAGVNIESAGLKIVEVNLKIHAAPSDAHLLNIAGGAKFGTGQLLLQGKVQLESELGFPAELHLKGDNLEVVKLPDTEVVISPALDITYAKNKGNVSGKLTLAKAKINLPSVPEKAIVPSEDEVILGEEKPKEKANSVPPSIAVDVNLDLGKQTHFSGVGLNTDLIGHLKITQKGETLAVHGNVDMLKARFKSYGQDLTVRHGRFLFNGPPSNPYLDVEAIRLSRSKLVTAVVTVTGSLSAPLTQISAEPALPESEALAYLITGRSLSQVSKADGNALASAALAYGGGQMAWLTEKFGIDEFEIQEGETLQDSLVAVGQYLTPDFYVGAKVGLFNKQTSVLLKYKLTDRLSISTQAGDSQRLNLNYEFTAE